MEQYEVMHEVFVPCTGSWEMDGEFPQEVSCHNPEEVLRGWFHGILPPCQRETRADGTVTYVLDPPHRERYHFSRL